MPNYTFELRNGEGGANDPVGVNLANRRQALQYAQSVIHELMHGRERKTRMWRLDVVENDGERIFEIPFDSVDETLAQFPAATRQAMGKFFASCRSFSEAAHDMVLTLRESRALVARSRGKPYVAARFGVSTIRDK